MYVKCPYFVYNCNDETETGPGFAIDVVLTVVEGEGMRSSPARNGCIERLAWCWQCGPVSGYGTLPADSL